MRDLAGSLPFYPRFLNDLAPFCGLLDDKFVEIAAEAINTVLAISATRAAISGSASPALISLFSLLMIATGVFFGAPTPIHPVTSYPGRKSPSTGTSGSHGKRVALVTASARRLPALIYPMDD